VKQLVWLASYPKSGNTWVRAFLTAYKQDPGKELDIDRLDATIHAADRSLFDRVVGFPSSSLTPAEIDRLRPEVYRSLDAEAAAPVFCKVHDVWRRNDQGSAIFPADATRLVIYIVRNPLAVAPSFAHHYGYTLDDTINRMTSADSTLAEPGRGLRSQLPQPLGSWSDHVAAWLNQNELPVHKIRYEDLHADPEGQFTALLERVGLVVDSERLAWALAQSRFDRLQAIEAALGFKERLLISSHFFRRGKLNAWRDELSPKQIDRIVSLHGEWMYRLGYVF